VTGPRPTRPLPPLLLAGAALLFLLSGCNRAPSDPATPAAGGEPAAAAAAKPGGAAGPRKGGGPPAARRRPGPGRRGPTGDEPVPVRVAPLRRRDMRRLYVTSGTLRALQQAPVVARSAGILREILVEEGDRVEAGQLMAVLEDDQARAELDKAEVDLEVAQKEFDRAEKLRAENLLSAEEYEQKKNALAQARTARELARLRFEWTRVRAPFAGVVTARHLDAGATVATNQAIFELANVSRLLAEIPVPEAIAAKLRPGGEAILRPTALGREVPARIERIGAAVDPDTGTVKVTLAARPVPGMKPGSFVEVSLPTELHAGALVAPGDALVADGERWLVYVVVDGTARAVPVTTGIEDGDDVEIVPAKDAGVNLEEGTPVVVAGAAALADGTPVRPLEPGNAAGGSRGRRPRRPGMRRRGGH